MELRIHDRQLHYQCSGTRECERRILWGHSYLWHAEAWNPVLGRLSAGHFSILPDLWGHGASENPPQQTLTTRDLADHFAILVKEIAGGPVTVIGHSIGGMWGTQLAIHYPELVKSLVLVCTDIGEEPEPTRRRYEGMMQVIEKYGRIPPDIAEPVADGFFGRSFNGPRADYVSAMRDRLLNYPPEQIPGMVCVGRSFIHRPDLLSEARNVQVPVLIIAGNEDVYRSIEEARRMEAAFPNARLVIVEKSGHMLPLEAPDDLARLIDEFIT